MIATSIDRTGGPRPVLTRLLPPKRSCLGHIFADEIVLCMVEARRAGRHQVDRVAARIWSDIQPGRVKIDWRDLPPGSSRHRRMIAAARAALGEPDHARTGPAPGTLD